MTFDEWFDCNKYEIYKAFYADTLRHEFERCWQAAIESTNLDKQPPKPDYKGPEIV